MPNLKKINLLGHLNPRHDSPDDAVVRFIELVAGHLNQAEPTPVVNLLSKIIVKAGQVFKNGLPVLKQSPVSEFFEFLKSLRSELNPEQPFDEKFEALKGQINETVQYLVSGLETVTDESIIKELRNFAGIETVAVTSSATEARSLTPFGGKQNGLSQLEMPAGLLQQLFEPDAVSEVTASAELQPEPVEEEDGIVSGPIPLVSAATVPEIVSAGDTEHYPAFPVTGTGKTELEFGFNLAELFQSVSSPQLQTPYEEHSFIPDDSSIGELIIDSAGQDTGSVDETELIVASSDEQELIFNDLDSEESVFVEESDLVDSVITLEESPVSATEDLLVDELAEIGETEIGDADVFESAELTSLVDESTDDHSMQLPVPDAELGELDSMTSDAEEESFEESLNSHQEFDVSDLTVEEQPADDLVSEISEEPLVSLNDDELVTEDVVTEIPDEEILEEIQDSSDINADIEPEELEPADNLQWMVQQILLFWNQKLSAEQNFEIIQAGMQELVQTPNPLAAFRDVSGLPAYVDFVDFLDMLNTNPDFDRDVVRGEIDQIASRTFQLFNDILLQQTRPDLGELSDDLDLEEDIPATKEDTVLEDTEEPVISESVFEAGESLLVDQEGPSEADLIPEQETSDLSAVPVPAGMEDISLSDDSIEDHVLHSPEEASMDSFVPTEPVYYQVIQDLYADIRKLNSISTNNANINQFVDFSRSLRDPVELLREHTNIDIVKEFLEFIDELHNRFDLGQKNAYQDLAGHRLQIADRLYEMLVDHPEIIGEEPAEEKTEIIESPLHLVSDSEEIVDESLDLVEQLPESMIGGVPLPDDTQPMDTSEAVEDLLNIEEETTEDHVVAAGDLVSDLTIPDETPAEHSADMDESVTMDDQPEPFEELPTIDEDLTPESIDVSDKISGQDLIPDSTLTEGEIPEIEDSLPDDLAGELLDEEPLEEEVSEVFGSDQTDERVEIPEEMAEIEDSIDELSELTELLEEPEAPIDSEPEIEIPSELMEIPDALVGEEPKPAAPISRREKKELNEIQQIFLLEAEENIQKISDDLLVLEKDLGNISIIDGILRSAHTLKGSAAMMKFGNMSRLGHKMEDVFQILRDDKMSADRDLIDIMLKGTDLQTLMLSTLREEGHDEVPGLEETIFKLEQYLKMLEAKQEGKAFVPDTYEPKPEEPKAVAVAEKTAVETAPGDQAKVPAQQQGGQQKGIVSEQTLRINITTLNSLINLAAELLISRNRMNNQLGFMESILLKLQKEKIQLNAVMKKIQNFAGKTDMGSGNAPDGFVSMDEPGILQDFADTEFDRFSEIDIILRDMRSNLSNFEDLSSEIRVFGDAFRQSILSVSSIANELNIEIMSMRMVPVKHMFIRFQRSIRDIGREEEKDVDLKVEGEDTRLDKTVMEEVIEPIMHCVRNAVSHGIELPEVRTKRGKNSTGLITLRAYQDGNQVVLEVEDDGNGIDAARLKVSAVNKRIVSPERAEQMTDSEAMELMFVPGFSTAEKVTSLSGRGVGMDVVKNVVNKFKGNISVKSTLGKGSCFTIRLPLTLAINQSLLIQVIGKTYAFPLNTVEETVELHMENIQRIGDQELITVRDETIPLIHLANVLGMDEDQSQMRPKYPVVILSEADQKIAIRVDRLIGKEEIVVKNLGSHLKNIMGVTGATVLGDGSVILILDVAYLFRYWQGGSQTMISPVRSELHRLPAGGEIDFGSDEELSAPVSPEPTRTRVRGKIRVLCADDSVSIRKYVESLLRREEFEVVTAPDGAEAFDIAERNKFDLIMTDLEMPKMHGYELISAIRSRPNLVNIPIVILTARSGEKHRRRGLELGANAFLNKPFDVDELLNTIYSLIPR